MIYSSLSYDTAISFYHMDVLLLFTNRQPENEGQIMNLKNQPLSVILDLKSLYHGFRTLNFSRIGSHMYL